MDPKLSRRVGQVMAAPVIRDMSPEELSAFRQAVAKASSFGTLEPDYKAIVLQAESQAKAMYHIAPKTVKFKVSSKGSSKSGNYGHAGRPGKLGGSAPKSKAGWTPADDAWLADKTMPKLNPDRWKLVKEFMQANYPGMSPRDIVAAYEIKDEDSGLQSVVSSIRLKESPDRMVIGGGLVTKDGNPAGFFTRSLYPGGTIEHDSLSITVDKLQGQGFGAKFYKASEDVYKRTGVKQVELLANLEVGGYAWARMGFDFANANDKTALTFKAQHAWRTRYPNDPMPNIEHTWDIAALTGPDGTRLGKDILLGTGWLGAKSMDGSSLGVAVGNAYYAAKGKK